MKAFIFDTETTGLVKNSLIPLPQQPRIIEFFGHVVDDETGEVAGEIEFFANPGSALSDEIIRITGIKPEQLADQQPFSAHAPVLADLIATADAVVAHNLSFDQWLVDCEFAKADMAVPCEFAKADMAVPWPARKICTVEQTEWIKGHRLSLSNLHQELFGEPMKEAHRARVDVQSLTRCYLELRKRGDI